MSATNASNLRSSIAELGVSSLTIDHLALNDLPDIGWSGNPAHIRSVAAKLDAAARGEADYLAVRAPDGSPIAKCVVEYNHAHSEAEVGQLAVRDDVQGLGIATELIRAAEVLIRDRGMRWALLGVEEGDERPRLLYERLGYGFVRRERASWEVEDEAGHVFAHEAVVLMLRKEVGT